MILARDNFVLIILRILRDSLHLVVFPEIWDVFLVTFADGTLVIIAKALLGPEGTLTFQINLVSAKERCFFKLAEDR